MMGTTLPSTTVQLSLPKASTCWLAEMVPAYQALVLKSSAMMGTTLSPSTFQLPLPSWGTISLADLLPT